MKKQAIGRKISILINLTKDEIEWLDGLKRAHKISRSEIIRAILDAVKGGAKGTVRDIEPRSLKSKEEMKVPTPVDIISKNEQPLIIKEALKTLTKKERYVLKYRYGLFGAKPKRVSEIAASLGLSGQRVRQIEMESLRKLRYPSRAKALSDYGRLDKKFYKYLGD